MSYTVLSAVKMTPYLHRSAQTIADAVDFDIVITSGLRTAQAQAQAMFTKIELGDDLIALYADDSFAQGVIDAYPNMNQAVDFIQGYFDQGKGSAHGRGEALDIRTTGGGTGAAGQLSESQIAELISAIQDLGYRYIREEIPPHIDVRLPPEEEPEVSEEREKKSMIVILLLIGAGIWIYRK